MRVAVLGAGIVGVSAAVRIQEAWPECDVVILADKASPDVTSDGAAGLFTPGYMDDTPADKVK